MFAHVEENHARRDETPVWEPRLRRIVADTLGLTSPEVLRCASLVDDLGVDSLDFAELVFVIEECFGIVIDSHAMAGLRSFADVVGLVSERMECGGCRVADGQFSACCAAPGQAPKVTVVYGGLDPYDVEALETLCTTLDDGSNVDVRAATHDDETRRWFERRLEGLRRTGLGVSVSWAGAFPTGASS